MLKRWLALAVLAALPCLSRAGAEAAAPGSWQGRAPAFHVARSDARSCSQSMVPPALAGGRRLGSLAWRFEVPAGAVLQAWLCHPQRCIALPGGRGRSRDLAGLDAGAPLQLCFRLGEGATPRRVGGLQLLVEYR